MLRVLSYNIWVGGVDRVNALVKMMQLKHPDIIGIVEATDSKVFMDIAEKLNMDYYCLSGIPIHEEDWQVGLLSRLPFVGSPIVYSSSPSTGQFIGTQIENSVSSLTKPLLEVTIEEPNGNQITIFVAHLTANFSDLSAGDNVRKQEVRELLRILASKRGLPHLLMGDFSAIARGDQLKGSMLLRYVVNLQQEYKRDKEAFLQYPTLDYVVPQPFLIFKRFLPLVPRSKFLSALFDIATVLLRAPHGDLHLLQREGYIDCFRNKNPSLEGFTAPAIAPAARFDFIFASPDLHSRLISCSVIEKAVDVEGVDASDHLPVFAEFN